MDTGSVVEGMRRRAPWPASLACALLLILAGCATAPPLPIEQPDLQWAATGAGLLSGDAPPLETPESLLHVTAEMHDFAVNAVGRERSDYNKINALADALSSKSGLHIQYDAEATLSAEEAFRQRSANCLSYTLLFVALARSTGIDAHFNEVEVPPIWDLGDERTSLLYRHINARIDLPGLISPVIDVSEDYDAKYPQGLVSDEVAEAQYYNNRSVELRLAQQPLLALRYEARALQLAPRASFLWTNLAELYLLQGQSRAAAVAINRSLQLDDGDMLAYDTAANIYAHAGDGQRAASYRARAQEFRERNPYYHYQIGLAAMRGGDMSKAHDELAEAIALYPGDARFHFLISLVLANTGHSAEAEAALNTAINLSPDLTQQERYKSKFARLARQG